MSSNIEAFVNMFANQFDETDEALFNSQTVFKDFDEWNSLIALSIIVMVDQEYSVKIDGDDIRSSDTIEELYNNIMKKTNV
ncbi:MAG: acyl carrier protein [bacterium]|jgi:acyl carrier protein